jgi:hypothetical protein
MVYSGSVTQTKKTILFNNKQIVVKSTLWGERGNAAHGNFWSKYGRFYGDSSGQYLRGTSSWYIYSQPPKNYYQPMLLADRYFSECIEYRSGDLYADTRPLELRATSDTASITAETYPHPPGYITPLGLIASMPSPGTMFLSQSQFPGTPPFRARLPQSRDGSPRGVRYFRQAPSAMDTDENEIHPVTPRSFEMVDGENAVLPSGNGTPYTPYSPRSPRSPSSPGGSHENVGSNHEAYSLHLTENSLIATAVMRLNNRKPIDGDEIIPEEHECVICRTSRKTHVFVPCGHLCVCVDCAEITTSLSKTCPICRKESTNIMQVFT